MRDQLVKAAEEGLVLDLTRSTRPRRRLRKVPARHLRDLLLGRTGGSLDPRGIRLVGARIIGQLDLTDVSSTVPLWLEHCQFDESVVLDRAQLSFLSLRGSAVPALQAERLRLSHSLALTSLTAIGHGADGAVRLVGAHIGGQLDLAGAVLSNESGPALVGDGLQVDNDTLLTNLTATGKDEAGAVRLVGAHIGGQLDLAGAVLSNESGPALVGDGLQVDSDTLLTDVMASGHGADGAVRLAGAHIGGQLGLAGVLSNESGPALTADGLQVDSGALLTDLAATGHGADGAVRLAGAHIGGQLGLAGVLSNESGPALTADGLQVDSGALLTDLAATGHGADGAVRLAGAHITGWLGLAGAELSNESGPALTADRLQVNGEALLTNVTATGHGARGTVRLAGAHITGQLDLTGAELSNDSGFALVGDGLQVDSDTLLANLTVIGNDERGAVWLLNAHIVGQLTVSGQVTNHSGPALTADGLRVDSDTLLANLTATGHGPLGAVRLPRAQITGCLNLNSATLTNNGGPALYAESLQVESKTLLEDLRATGHEENGAVLLPGAHIAGQLKVSGQVINHSTGNVILDLSDARVEGALTLWSEDYWRNLLDGAEPRPRLLLDGFTYRAQPVEPMAKTWARVLQKCQPAYTPQPYRQLADVCRGAGDEERAKKVLIAQQKTFSKTLPRDAYRAWRWVAWATLGFGYRSGRALWFLLGVMAVSCGLMLFAVTQGWLAHPTARDGCRCGVVETVVFAVDRAVPLLRFGVAGQCELSNATPPWVFLVGLVVQILSWAFLTLFVAGFTGIVRKPST
ncbi:hypothetical protein AB0D83_20015 [Streptomyces decoyicus]|uniref:hypothetical protein n=1 Tax=Streptomyces decoyicus TaxID=249567 RepID=UPI0033DFEE71